MNILLKNHDNRIQFKIDRAKKRGIKRHEHSRERQRKRGYGDPYCNSSGGTREWCSICQMWSRNCCERYGSCQCS